MSALPLATDYAQIFWMRFHSSICVPPSSSRKGPSHRRQPAADDGRGACPGRYLLQAGGTGRSHHPGPSTGGWRGARARMEGWLARLRQQPDALLYCFRGGLRPETVQQWLAEAGITRPGSRAATRRCATFSSRPRAKASAECDWTVLTGMTGSGKTTCWRTSPRRWIWKGTPVTGVVVWPAAGWATRQHRLSKTGLPSSCFSVATGGITVVLEDESRLIGRCALPLNLYEAMCRAPLVVVEVPQEARAEQIRTDYVQDLWLRYLEFHGPDAGWPLFAGYLTDAMARLKRRLGDKDYRELDGLLQAALRNRPRAGTPAPIWSGSDCC